MRLHKKHKKIPVRSTRAILRKEKAIPPSEDTLAALVKRGRVRGFISDLEVLYTLPEFEEYLSTLDDLLDQLDIQRISLVETNEKIMERGSSPAPALHTTSRLLIGDADAELDSVQMYLQEIGKVPLLKTEDEIALAKRKERGDKEVVVWGTGKPRREFLHVDDLAKAALFLMQTYDAEAPINVGSGVDLTIAELANLVAAATGFKGAIRLDPSKPDGVPRKLLSVARLDKLGWKAAVSLQEGLAQTAALLRDGR